MMDVSDGDERVVQIEAGQDREDVGLQERDQQLQAGEHDDEGERRPAAEDAQHHDEAAEHLQHGVAGQHVGEQSDRQAERADEVGDDLDRHQQQQQRPAARPSGTNSEKKCRPCVARPIRVTPTNTNSAIAKVTTMWLVDVNE